MKLKKFLLSFVLATALAGIGAANTPDRDTTLAVPVDTCLNLDANMDSLLNLWYAGHYQRIDDLSQIDTSYVDSTLSNIPDSLIINRLSKIPSVVNLSFNHVVRNYIDLYTHRRKTQLEVMLGLSEYYFPIFDQIFDYYQLPNELKYLTIIESALNPRAYSRARAVGIWQFMYGTGRAHGLTINSLVDERMDPFKATRAACQFMSELYSAYHDWTLVIAAYNCGAGNVNKAIRRAGGRTSYWDIYYYLPRETRGYVPAYIAATYVMNYYREMNIVPQPPNLSLPLDTVMITHPLHLGQVSEVVGIPMKEVRDLNPQYFRDIIPAYDKPFPLTLPVSYVNRFIDSEDTIYAYKDSVFFNAQHIANPASFIRGYIPGPPQNMTAIYYRVRSGDNLGSIAMRYHVRVSDLRYWNGIHRNIIRSGQRLVVYVPRKKASHYKATAEVTSNSPSRTTAEVIRNVDKEGIFEYYTVKSGDTLWDIAKLYPGVSEDDIMQWNNFQDPHKIHPGQVIKIKKKS